MVLRVVIVCPLIDSEDVDGLRLSQGPELAVLSHAVADAVGGNLAHHVLVLGQARLQGDQGNYIEDLRRCFLDMLVQNSQ